MMYNSSILGYHFHNFINLLSRAEVILKIENDSLGSGNIEHLTFNSFSSSSQLESSLNGLFEQFSIDIEKRLDKLYDKIEKLNVITRHLVEVEAVAFLITDKDGEHISHRNFRFTVLSEVPSERQTKKSFKDIQDYLLIVHIYLSKIISYLSYLKENVEKVPQAEIPIPAHMIPDPNSPTEENPLAYFNYVLRKQGIIILKNQFKPSDEDMEYYDVTYDEPSETKSIPFQDMDTGEWLVEVQRFSDVLYRSVYHNFLITRDVIDGKISKMSRKKEIKTHIELLVSRLQTFRSYLVRSPNNERYPFLLRAIEGLIKYVFENYAPLAPKPSKVVADILKSSHVYELPVEAKKLSLELRGPGTFRWRSENGQALSLVLHQMLTELGFIAEIELLSFHEVFSGTQEMGHFHVRWVDKTKNGKHSSKVSLLYLFKRLIEENLIDEQFGSRQFLKRVEFVFRDHEGNRLENLNQSVGNVLDPKSKTSPYVKDINSIVEKLLKVKMS